MFVFLKSFISALFNKDESLAVLNSAKDSEKELSNYDPPLNTSAVEIISSDNSPTFSSGSSTEFSNLKDLADFALLNYRHGFKNLPYVEYVSSGIGLRYGVPNFVSSLDYKPNTHLTLFRREIVKFGQKMAETYMNGQFPEATAEKIISFIEAALQKRGYPNVLFNKNGYIVVDKNTMIVASSDRISLLIKHRGHWKHSGFSHPYLYYVVDLALSIALTYSRLFDRNAKTPDMNNREYHPKRVKKLPLKHVMEYFK